MSVLGFQEAHTHAVEVILPGNVYVLVASLPALLILKIIAWDERHYEQPRHEAVDIKAILASCPAQWNYDETVDNLLVHFEHDVDLAAAALIGRDRIEPETS